MPLAEFLSHCIQHILYKDPVAGCRVVDEDVCYRADQFAVLDDGGAMGAPPVADTAT